MKLPLGTLRSLLAAVTLVAQVIPASLVTQPVQAQTAPATTTAFSLPTATTVSNPPIAPMQILVFPQRDFVSASGYTADDRVVVTVQHAKIGHRLRCSTPCPTHAGLARIIHGASAGRLL